MAVPVVSHEEDNGMQCDALMRKGRARNNFPICSTSDGRTAALLVVAIARYDSSSRLALHPARRVQIGKLFRARSKGEVAMQSHEKWQAQRPEKPADPDFPPPE